MSILIKGMEMPKSCQECRWRKTDITNTDYCQITLDNVPYIIKFPASCPLIEVPPHGRLIDADELFKEMEHNGWFDNADRDIAEDLVLDAPTAFHADNDGEENG